MQDDDLRPPFSIKKKIGKKNMFGGSVCACADLLPPAGDG